MKASFLFVLDDVGSFAIGNDDFAPHLANSRLMEIWELAQALTFAGFPTIVASRHTVLFQTTKIAESPSR